MLWHINQEPVESMILAQSYTVQFRCGHLRLTEEAAPQLYGR